MAHHSLMVEIRTHHVGMPSSAAFDLVPTTLLHFLRPVGYEQEVQRSQR